MIRLDIFADPACPWCYLGKANLDRALEAHPDHPFYIVWHPFEMNPEMPQGGVPKREYLARAFGSEEKLNAVHERMREVAAEAGVEMDPDTPRRIPNTFDAQRLIHWAGVEGKQGEMVAALFHAYWVEGRDIGDRAVLAEIAGEVGLEADIVARLFETEADVEEIREREAHAQARGVNAVPTFIVADEYVVTGAQPSKLWTDVIRDLANKG